MPSPDRPGLIETLRREADASYVRLDRHLDRLARSAATLGLPLDTATVAAELASLPPTGAAERIRIELAADGDVAVTAQPFQPLAAGTVWRLALAATRLRADDPLLRHKTTWRSAYAAARAEFPADQIDEVLVGNERGELCEGTITSLFVDSGAGPLLTPPLRCGLLAGVLRASLIDEGRAVEAVLRPPDLAAARALYVGNSLRGLIAAKMA